MLSSRRATFARLAAEPFDLLVVGGGITGAGVARDAALRGLRVALVERDDWASGTSSRSSRLVHGGVRYLEHGHLHLVFESSRERRTLLAIAPHLVRPLEFTWPVYEGARVPMWKLGAGLLLYDALALFRNVAAHRRLSAAQVAEREPGVRREGLVGGATYYDAATDDARLTLANAVAAAEAGAVVLNHAEVRALRRSGGPGAPVDGALVVDTLGEAEPVEVRARVVVNATGPWTDALRRLDDDAAPATVRGSKGVHVTVPRERVGNRGALTLLSPLDGRVMFVLPAGAQTIVGTTETATDAPPDEVRASRADVDYLVRSANAFFPESRLGADDVISAWAGIRPLVARNYAANATDGNGDAAEASAATAATAASGASREHAIERSASGVITVTGGKLTTYRSMAAEVVDAVEGALGRPRPTPSRTALLPLPGGDVASLEDAIADAARATGDATTAMRLVHAHGSRWRDVWALAEREPALRAPLAPGLPYVRAELAHAAEHEMACTLADLLVRRTHVAHETRDQGRSLAPVAADVVAARLGWDERAKRAAIEAYEREAERLFGVEG